MDVEKTSRGFVIVRFKDIYGADCTLQESSLADRHAIWFGSGDDRMHLDAGLFASLSPHIYALLGMTDPAAEIADLRAKLADAVDKLSGSTERMEKALAAIDKYNEVNGAHIVGPSLLGLGVQIAGNRATLARIQGEN